MSTTLNISLSCYYLDEPLTPEELAFARDTMLGPHASFPTGAASIVERRIPHILPASAGSDAAFSAEAIDAAKKSLRKSGIAQDAQRQVLFVVPKDLHWAGVFQMAIFQETGFYPYSLQRWYYQSAQPRREEPRIIDLHALTSGSVQ